MKSSNKAYYESKSIYDGSNHFDCYTLCNHRFLHNPLIPNTTMRNEHNFKVGDRVIPRLNTTNPPLRYLPGMKGTITKDDSDGSRYGRVTITFDKNVGGHGLEEKNWYIMVDELELLVETPVRNYVFVGRLIVDGKQVEMTADSSDVLFDIADKLGGHEETRLEVFPRTL